MVRGAYWNAIAKVVASGVPWGLAEATATTLTIAAARAHHIARRNHVGELLRAHDV